MLKNIALLVFGGVLFINTGNAQNKVTENVVGFNLHFDSAVFGEEQELHVYLPEGYGESKNNYPVLYVLDGQRFFYTAVGLHQTFQQFKLTPPFIIVGLINEYPQRFSRFSDQVSEYEKFLTKEVIPTIDSSYHTKNERILFGWEYGGSFAMHLLSNQNKTFQTYLTASPYPISQLSDPLIKLPIMDGPRPNLFMTVSPNEWSVLYDLEDFIKKLNNSDPSFDWTFEMLEDEVHRSTPYYTLFHGLKHHFFYYPEMQVDDLQTFVEQGGIAYAKHYYQERSKLFGFENTISDWTRFTILRSAIRTDDPEAFKKFYEQLVTDNFLENLNDYRRNYLIEYLEANNEND
jgi:hypothetical protein